jgi:hypothetical protein
MSHELLLTTIPLFLYVHLSIQEVKCNTVLAKVSEFFSKLLWVG